MGKAKTRNAELHNKNFIDFQYKIIGQINAVFSAKDFCMKISLVQRNLKNGDKNYSLRFYDKLTRTTKYKSLKTENRIVAERKLADAISTGIDENKFTTAYFRTAYDSFLKYTEASKGYGKTVINYASILKPLIAFSEEMKIRTMNKFTNSLANEFICNFKDLKPSTIRQKVNCCRIFFKWCIRNWNLKMDNPFKSVIMPKLVSREKSFWKPEQITAILNATESPEMRFLFAFMAYEGFRYFEAEKALWSDFNGEFINVWGKGSKFAKIPISHKLREEIKIFLNGKEMPKEGKIFSDKVTNTESNRAVKRACAKSGIKFEGVANCHRFRHSFASNLIGAGCSVVSVQRLMRHSNASITLAVYSHIMKEDLNKDVDLI